MTAPRRWRGPWILAVAGLHTAFVLLIASGFGFTPEMLDQVGGSAPLAQMTPGFGSAQPAKLGALTFFWSIFFGLALGIVGVQVRAAELRGQPSRPVGGLLLALGLVGGILVPASGFWLLLPPAFSLARSG